MDLSIGYLVTSFIAGIFMFFAPCTFPLVPAFLASLTPHNTKLHTSVALIKNAFLFCVGFMCVFIVLGALSGLLGAQLDAYKSTIVRFGGIFLILFGIGFTGVFSSPLLARFTARLNERLRINEGVTPLLLGIIFALGWSPCTGPLLASILLLATGMATLAQGVVLLTIFSLGIVIPFMLVALFYARATRFLNIFSRYGKAIQVGSGFFVLLIGLLLTFGDTAAFTHVGVTLYGYFGYVPQCVLY